MQFAKKNCTSIMQAKNKIAFVIQSPVLPPRRAGRALGSGRRGGGGAWTLADGGELSPRLRLMIAA
jgi:hypothetical protein